jgi:hypothetical protein
MPSRIPTANDSFNAYILRTAKALEQGSPTAAVRLGLSAGQLAQWLAYRDEWTQVYAKLINGATRTKVHTTTKDNVRKAFIAFATPLLTAMGVHAALTIDDRNTFNLPERDRIMTKRGKIDDKANAHSRYPCKRPHQSAHGCRAMEAAQAVTRCADHLEMRYQLVVPTGVDANGSLLWPDPPISAKECPESTISTRAIFTLDLGEGHSGKRIHAFFRWVNARNLKLSGPWSGPVQCGVA